MRELTVQEMDCVSGGNVIISEPDWSIDISPTITGIKTSLNFRVGSSTFTPSFTYDLGSSQVNQLQFQVTTPNNGFNVTYDRTSSQDSWSGSWTHYLGNGSVSLNFSQTSSNSQTGAPSSFYGGFGFNWHF
jgi:hypothetical protein